jgi:dihydrolipoamide dehydrogenase
VRRRSTSTRLRGFKEGVVKKLTGGLAGMAKTRKVETVRGIGRFLDPYHVEVELTSGTGQDKTGAKKTVRFQKAIIAAGSQAVKLPFIPDDPRVVDSTGALELKAIPKRMLVIGGGIIGLEMATVYSTLGTRIDVVEMLDGMMAGADRDLVKVWEKKNAARFDNVMLKTKTVSAEASPAGIKVGFEGAKAPAEPQLYDLVLVAVGRSANGNQIGADKAGVAVTDRGFIPVDKQMRTNVSHIFRDRRHRRSADACAQGGARSTRGRRGRRGPEVVLRRAADTVGRLHRPRGCLGRAHRGAMQGAGHQVR